MTAWLQQGGQLSSTLLWLLLCLRVDCSLGQAVKDGKTTASVERRHCSLLRLGDSYIDCVHSMPLLPPPPTPPLPHPALPLAVSLINSPDFLCPSGGECTHLTRFAIWIAMSL